MKPEKFMDTIWQPLQPLNYLTPIEIMKELDEDSTLTLNDVIYLLHEQGAKFYDLYDGMYSTVVP